MSPRSSLCFSRNFSLWFFEIQVFIIKGIFREFCSWRSRQNRFPKMVYVGKNIFFWKRAWLIKRAKFSHLFVNFLVLSFFFCSFSLMLWYLVGIFSQMFLLLLLLLRRLFLLLLWLLIYCFNNENNNDKKQQNGMLSLVGFFGFSFLFLIWYSFFLVFAVFNFLD